MKHIEGLELHGLNVSEGRDFLAERCYKGFQYVYEKYHNDYDFFMRTDEDAYFVIENLRYLLSQYNPEWALWIGEKFHVGFYNTYLYKVLFICGVPLFSSHGFDSKKFLRRASYLAWAMFSQGKG
jgi:hypothetical protein